MTRADFSDCVFTFVLVFFVWAATIHIKNEKSIAATGHTTNELLSQKKECESSGNECVMVFDFVEVKKEKAE